MKERGKMGETSIRNLVLRNKKFKYPSVEKHFRNTI